ncbi:MAG: aspartate aminotransferase family protein [Candidatus Eremiobacterota bacterium]
MMRYWYEYGEVLDEEEYGRLFDEQIGLHERHLNPSMARNLRALGTGLIEWRGEGAYMLDPRGKRYYDCIGAGGALGLGHCHPDVIAAVKQQLDRFNISTRIGLVPAQANLMARLAEKVVGDLPFGYFGSTGTESVEAALKLARLVTNRPGFIGMRMGYHGMSTGTLSVSGIDYWRQGVPLLPECRLVPYGETVALEQALDSSVAAVVLEPVQWASACTVATPAYLRKVRELCDRNGSLLILDEIQSGLGRTGRWWAYEESGVVPDILCVGKVLSGGVIPISATMYSPRVRQAEEMRPLFNNSTFGGNPLACAAALATLDVMERDRLVERAAELGRQLEQGFDELCRDYPDLGQGHKGIGLMRCLKVPTPAAGLAVQEMMRDNYQCLVTAMIHAPDVLRVSPPFVSTDQDMGNLLEAFRDLFAYLRKIGPGGIQAFLQDLLNRLKPAAAAQTT